MKDLATKGLALLVLLGAAFLLFKVALGAVTAILWILVGVAALVAVVWALARLL